jgi:M6 family metalloprotease-like protein
MALLNPAFLALWVLVVSFLFSLDLKAKPIPTNPRLSHQLSAGLSAVQKTPDHGHTQPTSIRIFAARVQFQPDEDTKTSGDGSFEGLDYLGDYGPDIIDPLPHDKAYFQRKLSFLKHYFETTSDGQITLSFDVSDTVITLSGQMSDYAPVKDSDDLTKLADMAEETWQAMDGVTPAVPFSDYDCFVIFHAGVGRDIDLVSSIGVDPTPFDIPSITFNLKGLKKVYGESFQGFSVDNGQTLIQNTLVLPQTESREIEVIGGDILQEISINGLLCASFGSYLGLPDLFDTKTGRSVIGRFGLMDGEGIFNYFGLLPPEPSAWERLALGWADVVEIYPSADTTLYLPALGLNQDKDSVIYKIAISSDEYFLLENRQRNPVLSGVTLTIYHNGSTEQVSFSEDQDGFSAFSIDSLKGDILASSNYDWGLPGGDIILQDGSTIEVQGGVLIWHIDEKIIQNNTSNNTIHTGQIKGVRLLEADGSNDIGQSYGITDAGNGSQSGTPLDYFYQSNPSPIYDNRIDETTFPNTNANSGAQSNIRFSGFSEPGAGMSLTVSRQSTQLEALSGFPALLPDTFTQASAIAIYTDPTTKSKGLLINAGSGKLYRVISGQTFTFAEALPIYAITSSKPAIDSDGNLYSVRDSMLYAIKGADVDSVNVGQFITTAPIINGSDVQFGTASGHMISYQLLGTVLQQTANLQIAAGDSLLGFAGNIVFTATHAYKDQTEWAFSPYRVHRFAATGLQDGWLAVALTTTNEMIYLYSDGTSRVSSIPEDMVAHAWPVVADLEHRQELSVIFPVGSNLYAFNEAGFLVTNFPFNTGSDLPIKASAVVADIDGDTFEDILLALPSGKCIAVNRFGKQLATFALADSSAATPAITTSGSGGLALYVVDKGGFLQGWRFKDASKNIQWAEQFATSANSNRFEPIESQDRVEVSFDALMPQKRVYNWPNPASEETRFRFYLTRAAEVNLSVYDLTGRQIWRKRVQGKANSDQEVLWLLGNVESGIYYGLVEAKDGSKTEQVKLKIAIVK